MTRKQVLDLLSDIFRDVGVVELRRDLERVPFGVDELPRIVVNDDVSKRGESVDPLFGHGGPGRWSMRVSVVCASLDDDEAAQLVSDCVSALEAFEASLAPGAELPLRVPQCAEVLGFDLAEHDFAVVQDEHRVVMAGLVINVDYMAGRWEI